MPRYLTSHTMACMTRQAAQQLAASFSGDSEVRFLRLLADITGGRLFGEFEAPSREQLLAWFQTRKVHSDWVSRVDLEAIPEGVRDL